MSFLDMTSYNQMATIGNEYNSLISYFSKHFWYNSISKSDILCRIVNLYSSLIVQHCNMETTLYSVCKVKVLRESIVFKPSNKMLVLTHPLVQQQILWVGGVWA